LDGKIDNLRRDGGFVVAKVVGSEEVHIEGAFDDVTVGMFDGQFDGTIEF